MYGDGRESLLMPKEEYRNAFKGSMQLQVDDAFRVHGALANDKKDDVELSILSWSLVGETDYLSQPLSTTSPRCAGGLRVRMSMINTQGANCKSMCLNGYCVV